MNMKPYRCKLNATILELYPF